MADIEKMMANQKNVSVKYEKNGKKKTRTLTLKKPGYGVRNHLQDLINVGESETDWGAIFEGLMQSVIVSPKWSYSALDKMIPESKKEITVTDENDKDNKVTLRFPTSNGYRVSVVTTLMISSVINGKLNSQGYMDNIMSQFILDPSDETKSKVGIDKDFFDYNYAFGDQVRKESAEWLAEIVNYEGILDTLIRAYQFLSES